MWQRCLACLLTVKLRGRTTTCQRRGGPAISTGSRRANQTTHHGPLQRLLEVIATHRSQKNTSATTIQSTATRPPISKKRLWAPGEWRFFDRRYARNTPPRPERSPTRKGPNREK